MKKALSLILALVMVLALLAGCTNGGNSNETTQTPAPASNSGGTNTGAAGTSTGSTNNGSVESAEPAGALPLTGEKVDFELWVTTSAMGTNMSDLNEGYAIQELEKRTNVHINWTYPSSAAEDEQFNLLVTSQLYPDSFVTKGNGTYVGGLDKYIDDEVILDLKSYRQFLPNYIATMKNASVESVERDCYTDTGALPVIRMISPINQLCYGGYMVREDLLNEVGFAKKPSEIVTMEDFHDMLAAIKDFAADGTMYLGSRAGMDTMLLQAWGITGGMYQVDGTVKYGPMQPEFKEYLSMVTQWYSEGLIDKAFMTRIFFYPDAGLFMNDTVVVMPHVFTFLDTYQKQGELVKPDYKVTALSYPKLHAGDKRVINTGTSETELGGAGATVTTACENPELLCRWWDYMFSDEGALLMNYGIEGLSYEMVDGKPKFLDVVTNNPDIPNMNDAVALYALAALFPFKMDPEREITDNLLPEANEARSIWDADWDRAHSRSIMGITMTAEESSAYTSTLNDINTYVEEYVTRTITGLDSIDNFDSFVAQIQSMGIDRCIAIQQAALDRYNSRVID